MAVAAPEPTTLTLSETQRAFVFDDHRYSLFLGGIGAGKSHAGAVKAVVQEFSRERPTLGIVIAPTYPMLRDATWRTALELWSPLIEQVVRSEMAIMLRGGHEVLFRSADDPDRLRGPNASWAWIDEAALCHPVTWLITIGRLRQGGEAGRAWGTTTPKGMNWVWETFVQNATAETAVYRAATWANPFLDPAFVDSLQQQYAGDFASQELDAEFVADQEGTLIEWKHIDAANQRPWRTERGGLVAGVDVAGPGDDQNVVCLRRGNDILSLRAWDESDPRRQVIEYLKTFIPHGLKRVNVDHVGIGWYFFEDIRKALASFDVVVQGVNVGEASVAVDEVGDKRFANLKAEYYWHLRELFAGGHIAANGAFDPTTISQLSSVKYGHPRRLIEIESKDKARARGVKSPDRAEAVMLAFAPESADQQLGKAFEQAALPAQPKSRRTQQGGWIEAPRDPMAEGAGVGIWGQYR